MSDGERTARGDPALCRECGGEIDTSRSEWSAEELVVCTDCWFEELTGAERREIAEAANAE